MRANAFIIYLMTVFTGLVSSVGFTQEKHNAHNLDSLYKNEKGSDPYNQFLKFFKKWDIGDFNDKEAYIHFIVGKGEELKSEKTVDYAKICFQIATLLDNNNKPYKAYEFLDKTSIALQNRDLSKVDFASSFYKLKGAIYYNFKRLDKSKAAFIKAIQLNTLESKSEIDAYNTLGLIYRDKIFIDSSIYYFNIALDLANESDNANWKGIIIGNLGYSYYLKHNLEKAKQYLKIDQRLSLLNHENESALSATSILVEIELKRKAYDELKKNITLMDSLNTLVHNYASKQTYYRVKTMYWEYLGEYQKAYNSILKSEQYKDSINAKHNQSDFQNMEFQINFQKKNAETQLLIEQEKRAKQFYYSAIIILSLFILTGIVFIYQLRKRRANERKVLHLKNEKIQYELETNKKELNQLLKSLAQKNEIINTLNGEIKSKENLEETKTLQKEKQILHSKIQSFSLLTENDLVEFKTIFNKIHPGFYDVIKSQYPNLSKSETRLTMLIRLGLSTFEMSKILGISEDSVRKTNFRLRKRLSINSTDELEAFIREV